MLFAVFNKLSSTLMISKSVGCWQFRIRRRHNWSRCSRFFQLIFFLPAKGLVFLRVENMCCNCCGCDVARGQLKTKTIHFFFCAFIFHQIR